MVSGSSPAKRGGAEKVPPRFSTYKEMFDYLCPLCMAMGMSYEDFWYGDVDMVPAYRKKDEILQERHNEQAWLQGMYIREAIMNALDGRKHKYPTAPYPLNTSVSAERKKREQEQNERKSKDYFMTFMQQWNKRFETKQAKQMEEVKTDAKR